jgi:hypothetical protein
MRHNLKRTITFIQTCQYTNMPKETIIKYASLIVIAIFYLAHTIKYSITFSKSILFSKKLKILHIFLFFLIPFIWIILLKELSKSTPSSYEFPNKVDVKPNADAYVLNDGE